MSVRKLIAIVLSLLALPMAAREFPDSLHIGGYKAGHVQGIAVDVEKGHVYASFTTMLVKTDLEGNVIGTVTGLLGHLGCLALGPDGLLYGSLEYKNDAIGKGILKMSGTQQQMPDRFYVAIFDVDKIDSENMDGAASGVMRAAMLKEPGEDYSAKVNARMWDGTYRDFDHSLACSGIDGMSFGPAFGKARPGVKPSKPMLTVAYGIYGDTTRPDNDNQVLLQYDPEEVKASAKPLSQSDFHQSGPKAAKGKYFSFTGNTSWGIQNLEYLPELGWWAAAVYKGKKPRYPNYSMYLIDGTSRPMRSRLEGVSYIRKPQKLVPLAESGSCDTATWVRGWDFPLGATGICSLGDGLYYICRNRKDEDNTQHAELLLHRLTPDDGLFTRIR